MKNGDRITRECVVIPLVIEEKMKQVKGDDSRRDSCFCAPSRFRRKKAAIVTTGSKYITEGFRINLLGGPAGKLEEYG